MSNSDFNEYGFAPGEVRGTRAWKIDKKGRLRGIVFEEIWRPGENVARCLRKTPAPGTIFFRGAPTTGGTSSFSTGNSFTTSLGGQPSNFSPGGPIPMGAKIKYCNCGCGQAIGIETDMELSPCSGMDPECSCGFYGYQQGSNDYYSPGAGSSGHGPVGGVIRGYGKVVLGTRGFRAEKAEVLALYIDAAQLASAAHKLDDGLIRSRIERNYGVPIFNDYGQLLKEFPPDMPEHDEDFWKTHHE